MKIIINNKIEIKISKEEYSLKDLEPTLMWLKSFSVKYKINETDDIITMIILSQKCTLGEFDGSTLVSFFEQYTNNTGIYFEDCVKVYF